MRVVLKYDESVGWVRMHKADWHPDYRLIEDDVLDELTHGETFADKDGRRIDPALVTIEWEDPR